MTADYYILSDKNQEKIIKPSEFSQSHFCGKLTNKEIKNLKENIFNSISSSKYSVEPRFLKNNKKYGKFAKLYDMNLDFNDSAINLNPIKKDFSIQIGLNREYFSFYLSNQSDSLHISILHDGRINTVIAVNKLLQKLAKSKTFKAKTLRFARDLGLSTDYFNSPFVATEKNIKALESWLTNTDFIPEGS
jgi:hypothetical protein